MCSHKVQNCRQHSLVIRTTAAKESLKFGRPFNLTVKANTAQQTCLLLFKEKQTRKNTTQYGTTFVSTRDIQIRNCETALFTYCFQRTRVHRCLPVVELIAAVLSVFCRAGGCTHKKGTFKPL